MHKVSPIEIMPVGWLSSLKWVKSRAGALIQKYEHHLTF